MDNDPSLPLTSRLDANLGYGCNNHCLFCYFRQRKTTLPNPSTKEAKRLLSRIRRLGVETVEMTGGEVTLRPDILELVSFAKETLGFKNISLITNGSRFCDDTFAAEAVGRGVNDVLVSVHGPHAALHDQLACRQGSFAEALRAIRNVQDTGASCRTNTVINGLNFKYAADIAGVLEDQGLKKINYIFFSPLDDAARIKKDIWVRYAEAAPFLRQMMERSRAKFETVSIKVIPFCFLDGLEDAITNFWQNIYDPYEWDPFHRVRIRRGLLLRNMAILLGLLFFQEGRRWRRIGLRKSCSEALARLQSFWECRKSSECRSCRYDKVCPGVWKKYADLFGLGEIRAVPGEKIEEVDFSLRQRFVKP